MGLLGEARGSLLVGSVGTPLGELSVSCTYRRLLGFGRPSNTPTYQSRPVKIIRTESSARSPVNIPGISIRSRRAGGSGGSSMGSEISSCPPPMNFYSGSPGSYTPAGNTPGTPYSKYSAKNTSPGFRRPDSQTRLVRTASTSSTSPCKCYINVPECSIKIMLIVGPQSPPTMKESPARYIPVVPVPTHATPIDINTPVRGAFVLGAGKDL